MVEWFQLRSVCLYLFTAHHIPNFSESGLDTHLLNPPCFFSPIFPQPCPEAFRVRARPLSARRSSLRMRGTRTSCRTQSPWIPRRRTPTARISKLLIGQDLGNPAYLSDARFHQKSKLGWNMRFPKTPTCSETLLIQSVVDKLFQETETIGDVTLRFDLYKLKI